MKVPPLSLKDGILLHPLQFGNGDSQCVFQRQNDSKTFRRLSKRVGRCRRETVKPKGANSEDLFAVAVTTGEFIIGRTKNFCSVLDASTTTYVNFLLTAS